MKLKSHLTCCRCNDEWPISLLAVMPAPDEDFYCGHCTDEMFWESRKNPDEKTQKFVDKAIRSINKKDDLNER
jgi:hypothetical protein